jgi:hypothetical protein
MAGFKRYAITASNDFAINKLPAAKQIASRWSPFNG